MGSPEPIARTVLDARLPFVGCFLLAAGEQPDLTPA
jgi:hypothetical protein